MKVLAVAGLVMHGVDPLRLSIAMIVAMPEYRLKHVLRTLHDHDERHLHEVEIERHHQAHQNQQR
jgi:hypothetical protein